VCEAHSAAIINLKLSPGLEGWFACSIYRHVAAVEAVIEIREVASLVGAAALRTR
jgi:hypothetical protein